MRYINMVNILVLMFLVCCKQYEFESDAEDEARVAEADAGVVAQKAAEEISKLTGKGVEEIKALSQEDLEKLAKEVEEDSEKFLVSARGGSSNNNNAKKAELIKVVKSSAEKFEKAFKTLSKAGYDSNISGVVIESMKPALEKLGLVEKLVGIANGSDSNSNKEAMKKALKESGVSDLDTCSSDINGGNPLNNGNRCMNNLLKSVENSFNKGVDKNIRDNLEEAPEKFKLSLQSLVKAAKDLSDAAGLIAALFN
ncbi:hypothetical protein DB313_05080 (plasmid) [Borrelia turcica IST7]|uniref:Uncharacterized protein n=1 Tax=Borrelia turcica IST7 TaxID=1104446 RepID=A0A386PPI3_9SPIR|nr:hypothetical protein [Borrelia turcica]AYE36873.1 hypothetical protein DB313_05080 [Borrelia turcica IST7]